MAKKDVDVRFNLIDNFTSSFKKTIETLTAGTKKAQNAWKSVEKFGNGISSLGTKATAAVTMPLVGLAAASATEFGSVDKSLKLVQQTMGANAAEAKGLESAIKSAAANSVYGMQDAADAALNFARQGFDAAQAADMIATGDGSCCRNRDRSVCCNRRCRKCHEDFLRPGIKGE